MKVMSGELAPRTSEAKAPVEKALDSGRVAVQTQPSGAGAPPLSGREAVQEPVTVSEAARNALEEREVMEVAPWNEAVRELRNRILMKMLDAMDGKLVDFSDIHDLRRRAEAGEEIPQEEMPTRVERSIQVNAQDESFSLDATLKIAAVELEAVGLRLSERLDWELGSVSFPGERSQVPFDSLTFAVDVGEARGEMGDLGLRELSSEERADNASSGLSAVRVWSMGSHPRDSSLMGILEVTPEGLSMSEVAPAGPQVVESTVPAHRASDAYRESEQFSPEISDRDIIL